MFALHCLQTQLSMMPKTASPHLTILWLLLVVSLSACSSFELRNNESQPVSIEHWVNGETGQRDEVLMLLNWFKVLDSLSPNQLKAAHRSAERIFSKLPTPVTRLQLAWLLTLKNTGFQDLPRAAKLLSIKQKSDAQGQQPEVLNDLVYHIQHMVVEQKLQQDKHRQVVDALNKERKTSKILATKIKDLTQIEESMIQRKPLPETELR